MNFKPLEGIRVVELGTHVAVPATTRIMADWGAEVIKVEPPRGEPWRKVGDIYGIPTTDEENPLFLVSNANKKGLVLNLKTDEGTEPLYKLIDTADVFISNTRLRALDKMGLGYETLSEKFPKLIYAHFTGFGEKGPDSARPGFDNAAFWAKSGVLADWTAIGEYPFKPTAAFGDNTVAAILLSGILAALMGREKTGKGEKVSASLYGTGIWYNNSGIIVTQDAYGKKYPLDKMEPRTPLSHVYRCKDNEWLMIALVEYGKYFPIICKLLELDDMIDDARYCNLTNARRNMSEIVARFNEAFLKKEFSQWEKILIENDIVFEKLAHMEDVSKDEQAWVNDYIYEYEYENGNKAVMPRTPIKFSSLPLPEYKSSPKLGEHTEEILAELGYSKQEILEMIDGNSVLVK